MPKGQDKVDAWSTSIYATSPLISANKCMQGNPFSLENQLRLVRGGLANLLHYVRNQGYIALANAGLACSQFAGERRASVQGLRCKIRLLGLAISTD